MRFVQFADTHLDSYISGAIRLGSDRSAALLRDLRTAFSRACALAVERHADLVLIPGDLFDYETADASTAAFLMKTLAEIAPIRVFITPGNHDSLRPGSPYLPVTASSQWPGNVHIFTSPRFESVSIEELGCSITGIAHAHRGITDRILAAPVRRPACPINILLFHGSRDGYKPSEKETVIPFSDAELLSQGYTYAAIGHYHSFAAIQDHNGCVRGAYSGCTQGRGLDETGEKCVLVGEIDLEGNVALERVEVASRRIISVDADITGCRDNAAVLSRMDAAVSGKARECDVLCVSLSGLLPPGLDLDTAGWESSQSCFGVNVGAAGIQPDYDLEALARESAASPLKSSFVKKMLEREAQAATDEDKKVLHDAVYYGLYALDGKKLEPRDAD